MVARAERPRANADVAVVPLQRLPRLGDHLGLLDVRVCVAQRIAARRQEPCGRVRLHGKGCVPELAAVVALHLHAIFRDPEVIPQTRQVPARLRRRVSSLEVKQELQA